MQAAVERVVVRGEPLVSCRRGGAVQKRSYTPVSSCLWNAGKVYYGNTRKCGNLNFIYCASAIRNVNEYGM